MNQTIQFQTKDEYVYQILREAILHGQYKPGQRIVMDQISEEMQVSHIPVRSAVQRLQAEGWVDIIPHTGVIIREIQLEDLEEVFLMLQDLEVIAFTRALDHITSEDINNLQQLVSQMDESIEKMDVDAFSLLNNKFHREIARMSHYKLLEEITVRLFDQWTRIRYCCIRQVLASRIRQAQEEHHRMLQLIREKDRAGLGKLVKKHNQEALNDYMRHFSETKDDHE